MYLRKWTEQLYSSVRLCLPLGAHCSYQQAARQVDASSRQKSSDSSEGLCCCPPSGGVLQPLDNDRIL